MLLQVPAGLDQARLVAAIGRLADTHPILQARLDLPEGAELETARLIPPTPGGDADVESRITRVDVAGLDGTALDEATASAAAAATGRLDPRAGVMLQAVWFDAGPEVPGRLLLVAHHLVIDGVSWRILLPDLAAAYTGEQDLQPVGTSFTHWAATLAAQAHQPTRTAELPTWTDLIGEADAPLGARPLDAALDTVGTGVRHVSATVPAELTSRLLTSVPEAFHAGVDDVLLAGLLAAVGEWLRSEDRDDAAGVVVDVEGHGRVPLTDGMDLTRTVGWFTSVYPVRLSAGTTAYGQIRAGGAAAGTAVKTVKERLRAVPGDGLGYGILRYLNPETAEQLRALPTAQIGFNYLGRFTSADDHSTGAGADWQPTGDAAPRGTPDANMALSYPLQANSVVRDLPGGPELTVSLTAPRGLLDQHTLDSLVAGWTDMLAGIAGHAAGTGGGHTPSDFALVDLGQDEIDEFEIDFTGQGDQA